MKTIITTNIIPETVKCQCGESFQWKPLDWMDTAEDRDRHRPDSCPSCEEREEKEREAEKLKQEAARKAEQLQEWIEEVVNRARTEAPEAIPLLFLETDTAHPRFNLSAWNRVKDHALTAEKPWLGLIGETGLSKTRIAALIFIEEAERCAKSKAEIDRRRERATFIFTTGYRICELAGIVQTGSFDQKEQARAELERITTCDLLLIDDLGKGKVNDAVAASLFALMDHRYANVLRTLWTANSTPEQIAAALPVDMAAPFAGRLNDHSRIIKLRSKP